MGHQALLLSIYLMNACRSAATSSQMVGEVVDTLGIRQVIIFTPAHPLPPPALDNTGAAQGEVLDSLWAHGISVSVFRLLSTPNNLSSAHDAVDEAPIRHNIGVSTQLTGDKGDDHVPEADSASVGGAGEVGFESTMATGTEESLKAALCTADGKVAVILVGGVDWVTHLAIHMNQMLLLGPSNILLLHPTSGSITEELLVPHLRLVAKVIVLEQHRPKTWLESSGNGGASCTGEIKKAILLGGGTYALRTAGCWFSGGRGLVLWEPLLAYPRTLHGASVIVVIVKDFIEAVRVGPRRAHLVGYLGKVINALARSLGFRYTIMEGSSFGSKAANGSFDGVVGHIERKEGDLGLASLSITSSRYQAIDYTSWLQFHPSLFVTRGPRYLKDPLGVFKLYTWQGWSAIAGFLVFSALWLWVFWWSVRFEGHVGVNPTSRGACKADQPTDGPSRWQMECMRPSFWSVLAIVLKAIVYQGSSHPPVGSPARLVYVCSWVVVMIVVAVYSGNLTAFLSIPIISKPPSTIRQLVTRDWTIRLDKAYGSHDLVKETKTEDYQTLYKRAKERGSILENLGATVESKTDISELKKKDIALVMGETGAFYTLNKNTRPDGGCTLAYSQEAMGKAYAALALPKQSLLKPVFDKKLRWMRQMGVLQKYYDDSFGVKCHQSNLMSSEPSAMTLDQLLGVFYVWAGGVGIACLVFLGEVFAGTVKGKN